MKKQSKKKEAKFKQYSVHDPIYRAHLTILIGDTDEIKQHLLKVTDIKEKYLDDVSDGRYIPTSTYRVLIMPKLCISTLQHELIHHAFSTMDDRGIPINRENDETIAYYYEMMIKNSLEALNSNLPKHEKTK